MDATLRRSGWFARLAIQFFIFIISLVDLKQPIRSDPIRLDAFTIAIKDDPVKTSGRENTSLYNITFKRTSTKSAIIIVEIHLIQTTQAFGRPQQEKRTTKQQHHIILSNTGGDHLKRNR